MEQADLLLESIQKRAEMVRRAESIVGSLSVDNRAVTAPYPAMIESVVAQGRPDEAAAALAMLTVMQKRVPLSYSLYLSSIPGSRLSW